MTPLANLLTQLRVNWQVPRTDKCGTSSLVCRFAKGISDDRLRDIIKDPLPRELCEMWSISQESYLFLDDAYGQWGLHMLSPYDAENETVLFREERGADAEFGDLLIGAFIGDSDLLLIRCNPDAADFGHLMVATPLYRRTDWPIVGLSVFDFLQKYVPAEGGKFWEARKR